MTSYERLMAVLSGGKPDRTPVLPIVRDWCIRQVGFRFSEVLINVEKYVYAQYFCVKNFGYDAVKDLAGIHAESEAMGSKLKIGEDSPPSVIEFAIKDYDTDLSKLKIPNPWKDGRLPIILMGIQRLKELCERRIPVVAYLQGPFRHASMLRGTDTIMRDVYKNPSKLKELLEIATESLIIFGISLVHAGADIIFISDPISSADVLSKNTWEEYGLPYTKRVVTVLKREGVKTILHVCGNTSDRLESLASTGVDGLSLDHKVNLGYARNILGEKLCLMGNLNPTDTLIFKQPNEVEEESIQTIFKGGKKGCFILSSGCSVPAITPAENIHAMVRGAKNFRYD